MPFRIREAIIDDISSLAELHVQAFNDTHRGGRPGGPSYELREQQWRQVLSGPDGHSFCFVVEDDHSDLVAFARGTIGEGLPGFVGELDQLLANVDPSIELAIIPFAA